jgi:cobalt-zinc-cadmium efflux system outer membrane protein
MSRWCLGAVVLAIGLAGCQPHPLADSSWPSPRPLGDDPAPYRPPSEPESDEARPVADPPDPSGALTLHQAMALAVARSPKLRAFGWEVRRAEARALQAGLWPNPEFEAEFENFAGNKAFSGVEALETTLSLAQTFPLGGDVRRRRELAGYEVQLAGWDYEAARLQVLTELTRRYVAVLAAQRSLRVASESMQLAEQVRTTTRKRIDSGDAPPIELARAGVPVATARVDLRRAERHLASTRKQLSLMWGSPEPGFEEVTGAFEQLREPPAAERIVSLINQNPDVARWAVEISAHRAEAQLAEAEAVPDLTGRIGYRNDQGENASALVVGLSLPLPIFDRRQGDILAARLGVASARERRREAELRLEAMLSQAYTRLADAYDEASVIRDEALPPATEAFDVTRRAFETGDLAFIDMLDAQRTLVELRTGYLDALADYHAAAAEIEGLIGRPLDTIAPPDDSDHTKTSGANQS